ncbi:MAG: EamA family transporter [Phycisphaera sp. RhM]|nr:EamA family transporter [Phycisphaera sp. RhM]
MISNPPPSEAWRGRLLIVLAAVMWSMSGFFAKAPWFDGWPPESRGVLLAFFRSLFALIILVPLVRRPEFRLAMIPMTVCFALMVWSFMSAMVSIPAASVIWLQYLSPAWVMLGAVTILKDRVRVADVRMFLFCIAGVALILAMELRAGGNLLAIALAVLSGITFAGVVLTIRSMSDVDSAWLITLNHAATVLLLLPWAWSSHQTIQVSAYVALGAFGVIQMSIPYIVFARGLRRVNSAEASMLILIEPILVPIWVYLAWRHHPSYDAPQWWTLAGGGLIFVGLVQRYLPAVIRNTRRRFR